MSDARRPPEPVIDEIVVGDEPASWERAGFMVDAEGTCQVGSVRIRLVGRERGKRILDWSLHDLAGAAAADGSLDGLATRRSSSPRPSTPARPDGHIDHPNGVHLLDHIVLVTPDHARTVAALEAAGFEARRTRHTDTYGAPFLQTFFRAAEVIIELIGPDEPSSDGPAAFFGLAYTVHDIDGTKSSLGDGLGEIKDAVQSDRRIATLRHKSFGMSVATAFMSPEPDARQAPPAAGDPVTDPDLTG